MQEYGTLIPAVYSIPLELRENRQAHPSARARSSRVCYVSPGGEGEVASTAKERPHSFTGH